MKSSNHLLLLGVVVATNAAVTFAGFVAPTGRHAGALHSTVGHDLHLSRWDTLSSLSSSSPLVFLFSSNNNSNDIQDDPVALLPLWEAEVLSSETSNDKRALLLERIENAKAVAEFGVRKAQFSFYDAFSNQDMGSMRNVWSSRSSDQQVRCVHPGMPSLFGIEDVMRSWAEIFMQSSPFTIQPTRTQIDISGQTALCSCIEETPGGGQLECLNVYRRENGSWKMILHMASPIMRMQQ